MVATRFRTAVLFTILSAGAVHPVHAAHSHVWISSRLDSDSLNTGAAVAVGAAVVGAVGYGLYKVGSWLFGSSDESVLDQTRSCVNSATKRYKKLINYMHHELSISADSGIGEQRANIARVSEDDLYAMARHDLFKDVNHECAALQGDLSAQRSQLKTAHKRINGLRKKSHHDPMLRRDLEAAAQELRSLIVNLEVVYDFLTQHQAYFVLYSHEAFARRTYTRELQLIDRGQEDMIVTHAMSIGRELNYRYPLTSYLNKVDHDRSVLKSALKNGRHYPSRVEWAAHVYDSLSEIASLISSNPAHAQEVRDEQHERQQRELMELQRQQNWMMQQQLWQMERKNQLKHQELLVKHTRPTVIVSSKPVHQTTVLVAQPRREPVVVIPDYPSNDSSVRLDMAFSCN